MAFQYTKVMLDFWYNQARCYGAVCLLFYVALALRNMPTQSSHVLHCVTLCARGHLSNRIYDVPGSEISSDVLGFGV